MNLNEALNAVIEDRFYAKAGQSIVLTEADVPGLISIVANGLSNRGHAVTDVSIKLDDKAEMIDVSVKNKRTSEKEDKSASVSLEWKSADGTYYVRIDTDGDGL